MNILVLSDSHGHTESVHSILEAHAAIDTVIFLGDGVRDMEWLEEAYPHKRFYTVRGNCDVGSFASVEGLAPFDGVLVLYTHGHLYDVKTGRAALLQAAVCKGADVALYGHTHMPRCEQAQGVLLANPGAVSSHPSAYGILTVEKGSASFHTHTLKNR